MYAVVVSIQLLLFIFSLGDSTFVVRPKIKLKTKTLVKKKILIPRQNKPAQHYMLYL